MTDGRRRWARITTASSAFLLLIAVISLWQVSDEFIETYDPEANYLVKLGPGESGTFDIEDSDLLSAVRVSDGETPDSNLTLFDSDGNEIPGKEPGRMDPDRLGADKTVYSPVRVFKDMGGSYTLQNQGSSDLWLVDDGKSAGKLFKNFWLYLFYTGCCIGFPVGIVGVVLAVVSVVDVDVVVVVVDYCVAVIDLFWLPCLLLFLLELVLIVLLLPFFLVCV